MPRKATGRPFLPGNPDGRAGRPQGTLNHTTREARELCQRLLSDPEYQAALKERLLSGKLTAEMEAMLWRYAYGEPPKHPISTLDYLVE